MTDKRRHHSHRLLATADAVHYGPDGKVIARNLGQTRFEILVDDSGTRRRA